MFGIGDTVMYGTQGVCRIEKKELRRVGGKYADYFVLRPVFNENCTVYIPQEKIGRHLHQSDEMILKQAEKLIYDELAIALGIKPEEVLPFIMEKVIE